MSILKITLGLVFAMAVIAYVHNPAQAKAIAGTVAEMLFTIGGAVRHAAVELYPLIEGSF